MTSRSQQVDERASFQSYRRRIGRPTPLRRFHPIDRCRPQLEESVVTEAVDFFFIPPDAPHQPINLSELRTVMDAVDDFCGRHQVDIAVNRRLNVVLDDLLANVIAYGFDDGQMLLGCPAYNLVRIRSLNAWLDERHT